jgi:hypothetical protein
MSSSMKVLPLLAVLVGVGCSDAASTSAPLAIQPTAANDVERSLRTPETYVAIGTSVSMGWASNGVYDGSQKTGFPALLAFGAGQSFSLPLIAAPGCISPIVPPLAANKRLNGDPLSGGLVCAPNDPGVTLPTQDLGLAQALAVNAVQTTPLDVAATQPWYLRVLPIGMTQLTAALAQHPTIVSVELGANEVLGALSGLFAPGVDVVPLPGFTAPYDALLNGLAAGGNPKVVLAGLPDDGRHLAALRRGSEIWADRVEFAALHVTVSPDCQNSPNYINVSQLSLNIVFAGALAAAASQPNVIYSCTDVPGTQDFILTPQDISALNILLGQMNDFIRGEAKARGYAFFSLGALYDSPLLKLAPYSIINQLTSLTPYSPFISLDGVHPSALGSSVLASAASVGYNMRYFGQGVGTHTAQANLRDSAPSLSLADQIEEPQLPAAALAQARRIAAENAGRKVSACTMLGIGQAGC